MSPLILHNCMHTSNQLAQFPKPSILGTANPLIVCINVVLTRPKGSEGVQGTLAVRVSLRPTNYYL